jgi:hypothetical protein
MNFIYAIMVFSFFFLSYKIRFKNFNRFKIYVFRKWIRFKYKYSKISMTTKIEAPLVERGIKIWKICVRDKKSELNYSLLSKIRQVKLDNFYLVFTEDAYERGTIRIYNFNESCSSYFECYITKINFEEVADFFDTEVEKRVRITDNNNKNILIDNMDKIIENLQK